MSASFDFTEEILEKRGAVGFGPAPETSQSSRTSPEPSAKVSGTAGPQARVALS